MNNGLLGLKFGLLTVIEIAEKPQNKRGTFYLCQCECGGSKVVRSSYLKNGNVKSCGCLIKKAKNFIEESSAKEVFNNIYNGEIIIYEYSGMTKLAKLKCNICEHVWEIQRFRNSIDNIYKCPNCKAIKSDEQACRNAQKKVNFIFDNIEILKYGGANKRAILQCKICQNTWKQTVKSLIYSKIGCEKCFLETQAKHYNNFIESIGATYISGEYKIKISYGKKSIIKIKYNSCNHTVKTTIEKLEKNFFCSECQKEIDQKNKIYNQCLEILEENNFELICFPDGIENNNSKIHYKCKEFGHINKTTIRCLKFYGKCKKCTRLENMTFKSSLNEEMKNRMAEWRKHSKNICNNKCILTGKSKHLDIHHIYGFNKILKESIYNIFGYIPKKLEFNKREKGLLIKELKRLHNFYGPGVCLQRELHILFHKTYGTFDNNYNQFNDFKKKYFSGEITL